MSDINVTVRPMLPALFAEPVPPGMPKLPAVINDDAIGPTTAYSSQKTEQRMDEARDELTYNYDGLVAAVLTI